LPDSPASLTALLKPLFDGGDRPSVVLDEVTGDQFVVFSAPHVGKEPRRDGRRCLPLLRRTLANPLPKENASLKVDIGATKLGGWRC
jgi:hypothetical protein